jgi:prolyl-tRNA editing enzyme YbaK/EbsC (Cys-tRNA(Pro) deacylase)
VAIAPKQSSRNDPQHRGSFLLSPEPPARAADELSHLIDVSKPAIRRIVDAAFRKGVILDIRPLPGGTHTPESAAAAVGAELGQIVTTMVFVAPRAGGALAPVICLASGRNRVDPHLLAALAGEVWLRAATPAETLDLTGYEIGRVPPFGHGHQMRTLMDGDLRDFQWVWALAGTADAAFRVRPRTLAVLSSAVIVPVAEQLPMGPAGAQFEPWRPLEVGAA